MSACRQTLLVVVFMLLCGDGSVCWPQSHHRAQAAQPKTLTTTEIVKRASRALVLITTRNSDGQTIARGSGFFLESGNVVVTNLHVLKWASEASAKLLADGVEYPIKDVMGLDLANDICLLWIEAATPAVPLSSGDSAKAAVGDDIVVAGNPKGLEGSFSKGIISGLRHDPDRLQIDASISPGSSGGPVLNMQGEVIGVATSSLPSGQNLNFAIPINLVPQALLRGRAMPVKSAGSISVSDRDRDGLSGPVRRVVVKLANYDPPLNRLGEEVVQQVKTYSPEGRVNETETFKDGWPNEKTYEYGPDGLLAAFVSKRDIVSNWPEGRKEEQRLSTAEAIMRAVRVVPFSTEVTSSTGSRLRFDDHGNVAEVTWGMHRRVCRFENQREVECSQYDSGVLAFKTRSTYEDDALGNWVVRHETTFLPHFPQVGYAPSADEVRQIDYYCGENRAPVVCTTVLHGSAHARAPFWRAV